MADNDGTVLTLSQLESHLWKAADILRGRIDSSDYKHYIFGLLFFKRLLPRRRRTQISAPSSSRSGIGCSTS